MNQYQLFGYLHTPKWKKKKKQTIIHIFICLCATGYWTTQPISSANLNRKLFAANILLCELPTRSSPLLLLFFSLHWLANERILIYPPTFTHRPQLRCSNIPLVSPGRISSVIVAPILKWDICTDSVSKYVSILRVLQVAIVICNRRFVSWLAIY